MKKTKNGDEIWERTKILMLVAFAVGVITSQVITNIVIAVANIFANAM